VAGWGKTSQKPSLDLFSSKKKKKKKISTTTYSVSEEKALSALEWKFQRW